MVITAGFGEGERAEGEAMLDAAKLHLLRIVGPNCLGVMSTPTSINASFAHISPKARRVAFLTQSGAVAQLCSTGPLPAILVSRTWSR